MGDNLGFLLTGFPGLENSQHWFAGPFSITLLIACFGNIALLFIIATEQSLHGPMYYFVFMLSATDLAVALTVLPKLLKVLWFGSQYLSYNVYIVQLFFIPFFTALESCMLVVMVCDHYVAVCNPLRYKTIMENQFVLKIMCFAAIKVSLYGIIRDFRREFPEYVHVLLSVLGITVPFTLNPIIYGIKAKEIRRVILKLLRSY
ncbi:olfactory receptor 52E8-like [Protopterus annectens]|uniref:olfactory receptor 52E8-like n=1 Tax=Protopterus annectens TaxID=7888 RepID=UPI001CFA2E3A|nr:olfactory receptor 52E8-like [Protopterus annectens]